MIRRTIALLSLTGAVALAVTGCGNKDSGTPLPSFGPTVTPPAGSGSAKPLDEVTLRNSLLDAGQLPSGYTAFPDPAPGSSSGAGATTDPARCAKVLAPVADQAPGAAASAVAEFGGPNFGSVDIDAASYANGGAAQAFSAVQSLVRECAKYSGTDADNTEVEFRLGGLEQPNAGDASTAFSVHTTSQGITLYSAVSVTMVGATVVQINMSGASEPDSQQLSALTAAQVRKLSGATGP